MYTTTVDASARYLDWRALPLGQDSEQPQSFEYFAAEEKEDGSIRFYPEEKLAYPKEPVISYFWPLNDTEPSQTELHHMALTIEPLPLCLVALYHYGTFRELGLALTGGGMWLGGHLSRAYAQLGYALPLSLACDQQLRDGHLEPLTLKALEVTILVTRKRLNTMEATLKEQKRPR